MSKIKDWKQITTISFYFSSVWAVVQDVKDQRLKANHNRSKLLKHGNNSGSRCQRSKIESKSQLLCRPNDFDVQWFKMSKIKDWKQITTASWYSEPCRIVVQDVKDQRLKANHNFFCATWAAVLSGSRCQRSKIESKSQQGLVIALHPFQWFKMSKIKDWKQITTHLLKTVLRSKWFKMSKIKDWKQITTQLCAA